MAKSTQHYPRRRQLLTREEIKVLSKLSDRLRKIKGLDLYLFNQGTAAIDENNHDLVLRIWKGTRVRFGKGFEEEKKQLY